jgi:hypothetical protein
MQNKKETSDMSNIGIIKKLMIFLNLKMNLLQCLKVKAKKTSHVMVYC